MANVFINCVAVSCTIALVAATAGTWSAWSTVLSGSCAACPGANPGSATTRICIPPADGTNGACVGDRINQTSCIACPANAPWNSWGTFGSCNDTCGLCGKQERSRTCGAVAGCPGLTCVGDSTEASAAACDFGNVCLFPRGSCCGDNVKFLDNTAKRFKCVPDV